MNVLRTLPSEHALDELSDAELERLVALLAMLQGRTSSMLTYLRREVLGLELELERQGADGELLAKEIERRSTP